MLPEIVQAVNGRAQIIVDGGINRGTDIVKAIAMGAHMVGLGRMQCYGLAADGVNGIVRMLELLELEVKSCMGLLGVCSMSELTPDYLCRAADSSSSHALSAFPHLSLEPKAFY